MQYTWKDEFILVILFLPFIGSFVPVVQDYVLLGWEYVSKAPPWYQFILIGVVLSTFGLRWYARKNTNEIMAKKTGTEVDLSI